MSQIETTLNTWTSLHASFAAVWLYFKLHWWLGLVFVLIPICLWYEKTKADNVNYLYSRYTKRARRISEISAYVLAIKKIDIHP